MIRVLFICHGNICRSPMAEFIMKDLVKKEGVEDRFHIESAATSREELGNPVYPPAKRELAKHGITCDGKTAKQLTKADYDKFDYLIVMDTQNVRNTMRIVGADTDAKIHKILEYCGRADESVADPWYTGDFETTWEDVKSGCEALLRYILNEN